jgi:hypothetical protein
MSTATVTLTKDLASVLPAANAKYGKTTITVVDSAGASQSADVTGVETPPWTAVFSNVAAVAGATGTASYQDFDVNGLAIAGFAGKTTFTEIGSPATFPGTTGISVAIA